MIVSRRLVSMGRKLCLFMYYVEQIDNKQWMPNEAMTLNGGMESKMLEGRIRRGFEKMVKQVFLLSCSIFSEEDRWSWLRFVVAASNFCYANDYTTIDNMFSLVIDSIRG